MKLLIKNMVCPRCIASVENLLQKNGLQSGAVRLGEVDLSGEPSPTQLSALSQDLQAAGFELLDDQRRQQIEKVKNLLIQKVQSGEVEEHFSISKFLSGALHREYSQISKLFSEVEGITVEQFFILQKIEKAKEWLVYNQRSLGEIALDLGYSSVQHLSTQFKRITGMTPGQFKKIGAALRKPLDNVHPASS